MTLHNADETARQPDTTDVTAAVDDADAAKAADQTATGYSGDALSCMDYESAGGGWTDRDMISQSCRSKREASTSGLLAMQGVQTMQQAVLRSHSGPQGPSRT